jgi:hypothetical protein
MSEGGAGGGGAGLVTKKSAFAAGYNDKRWRETPASKMKFYPNGAPLTTLGEANSAPENAIFRRNNIALNQ